MRSFFGLDIALIRMIPMLDSCRSYILKVKLLYRKTGVGWKGQLHPDSKIKGREEYRSKEEG